MSAATHLSHCYQGDEEWGNPRNCKYGDEACPAKPIFDFSPDDTEESIREMLTHWRGRYKVHLDAIAACDLAVWQQEQKLEQWLEAQE